METEVISEKAMHFRENRKLFLDGMRRCWKCRKIKALCDYRNNGGRPSPNCKQCEGYINPGKGLYRARLRAQGKFFCISCGYECSFSERSAWHSYCRTCKAKRSRQIRRDKGALSQAERHQVAEHNRAEKARVIQERRVERDTLRTLRQSHKKEYWAWCDMIARCTRATHRKWKYYGGRGIVIYDEWRKSFQRFFDDVGPAPHPRLSIDRINNDGNYEPGNVRWATYREQNNNQRRQLHRKTKVLVETF